MGRFVLLVGRHRSRRENGIMFVFYAIVGTLVALAGYEVPAVRNAEDILRDWDEG